MPPACDAEIRAAHAREQHHPVGAGAVEGVLGLGDRTVDAPVGEAATSGLFSTASMAALSSPTQAAGVPAARTP